MVDAEKTGPVDGKLDAVDGGDATAKRARMLELDGLPPGPIGEYARSLRELGNALGLTKSRAGQLAQEEWFPKRTERGWVIDACRRAVAAKRRGETPPALAPVAAPAPAPQPASAGTPGALPAAYPPPIDAPPTGNPLIDAQRERLRAEREAIVADEDLLAVLRTSKDKLALAQAAGHLAARRLSREPSESQRNNDLKRALEEWRRTEQDVIELGKARGELIERDAAKACMGALARRFVLACDRLEVRNAAQVELWLADAAFKALPVEDRTRLVRQWTSSQTRQARLAETEPAVWEEIERAVAAEVEDRKKAGA